MDMTPLCEPIVLPPGGLVTVGHNVWASPAKAFRHRHYHDVCEITVFEEVTGSFGAGGRRYPLRPGSVVFAPSMQVHDFQIEDGRLAWWLVHFDASMIEQFERQSGGKRLREHLCVTLSEPMHRRVMTLITWLHESSDDDRADRVAENIMQLLMTAIASGETVESIDEDDQAGQERVVLAIEQLRRSPAEPLSIADAASLCNMSAAYFSKQFRRVYGTSYAAYVLNYRLSLAARRILETRKQLTEIAFDLGFINVSHFSARFRRRFGLTPRDYRKGRVGTAASRVEKADPTRAGGRA